MNFSNRRTAANGQGYTAGRLAVLDAPASLQTGRVMARAWCAEVPAQQKLLSHNTATRDIG